MSVGDKTEGYYLSKQDKKTLQAHPEMCPASHFYSTDFKTLPAYRKSFICEGIHIAFIYNEYIKKLILKLKYNHRYDVALFLAERLALSIQSNHTLMNIIKKEKVYITYVPSHRYKKRFQRGYNQSELLAKSVGKILQLPTISLYKKVRHTKTQATLKRKQRLINMQGAFSIDTNQKQTKTYIIIIDDVTTTGSTIRELAQITKKQYPKRHVRGVAIARHQ